MLEKYIFLDRDGTISIDEGYTTQPEKLKIFPGAGRGIGRLKQAGYKVVIVTNQSAIGRGYASEADVEATNAECLRQLIEEDVRAKVDLVKYCPHAPEQDCKCRKPKTGMLDSLINSILPQQSWMVGDKLSDLELGINLGLAPTNCVLVLTGEGAKELELARVTLGDKFLVCETLELAAREIASR